MASSPAIVVMTTVGTEEQANLIAREMILRRFASCVNILPGIRSVYRWQGNICKDTEHLLLIKTLETEYEAVKALIQELHSYDLPEILALPIERGEQGFLEWIEGSVDKTAAFADEEDGGILLPDSEDL